MRVLSENRKKVDMVDCTLVDIGCATGRHMVTAVKMGYKVVAVNFINYSL